MQKKTSAKAVSQGLFLVLSSFFFPGGAISGAAENFQESVPVECL